MTGMDIFNIVVGVSTILSLVLSVFAVTQVISIKNTINVTLRESNRTHVGNQTIVGSGNKQAGNSIG